MSYGILVDDFKVLNINHLNAVRDIEFHGWNCLILCYNDMNETYAEPGYCRYRRVKRYFQDDPHVTVCFLGSIQRNDSNYLNQLKDRFLSIWADVVVGDFIPLSAKDKGRTWVLSKDFKYTGILKSFDERIEVAPYSFEELTEQIIADSHHYWESIVPTFYDLYGYNILVLGSPSGQKELITRKLAEYLRAPYNESAMRSIRYSTDVPYLEFNQEAYESAISLQYRTNLMKADSLENHGVFVSNGGVLPIISYAKFAASDSLHYLTPEMYEGVRKKVKAELIPKWARIYILNDTTYEYENRIRACLLETLEEYGIKKDIIYEVKATGLKDTYDEIYRNLSEVF